MTTLEVLAMDKHSSLLLQLVNYGQKSFIILATGANVIKPFFSLQFINVRTHIKCLLDNA